MENNKLSRGFSDKNLCFANRNYLGRASALGV